MKNAGFNWTSAGEVVYYGSVPYYAGWRPPLAGWFNSTGHREILMKSVGFAGFGTSSSGSYRTGQVCFVPAWSQVLTGVVYADSNQNGAYDPGEGLKGQTVTIDNQNLIT